MSEFSLNYCRFCLSERDCESDAVQIDQDIISKFQSLSNVELRISEKFSSSVCVDCATFLYSCHEFVVNVSNVQAELYEKCDTIEEVDEIVVKEEQYEPEEFKEEFLEEEYLVEESILEIAENVEISGNETVVSYEPEIIRRLPQNLKASISYDYPKKSRVRKFWSCDICGYKNKSRLNLKCHVENHLGVNYECSLCHETFTISEFLNNHNCQRPKKVKLKGFSVSAYCSICDRSFSSVRVKNDHFKTHHSTEKKFQCNLEGCNESFSNREKLQIHKQYHRNEVYPCEYQGCTKQFYSISEYTKHRMHHKKPFKCSMCSKAFPSNYKLQTHIKIVHQAIRETCPYCDHTCQHKTSMQEHILVKHMNFKIECTADPDCKATFGKKSHYMRHIKKFHTNMPNFEEFIDNVLKMKFSVNS